MTKPRPDIRRYSTGEISAMTAADMLVSRLTVADMFVLTRQTGVPCPRPSRERALAELANTRKVPGLG